MALLEDVPRTASVRARGDTELLVIHKEQMDFLLNCSLEAVRSMFFTVLYRLRENEVMLRQTEKMAQLGTLTAGVAHELNNPAAAVKRAAAQMDKTVDAYGHAFAGVARLPLNPEQQAMIGELEERVHRTAMNPAQMDGLARSDRENELEEWLDEQGFEEAWDSASALVELDFSTNELESLMGQFSGELLPTVILWLKASYEVHTLLHELQEGGGRISEIVKSLKTYSYLDQAPVQTINLTEGINSTLVILRNKLREGIRVQTEYEPALPPIEAYGSELNQVWTNILDNAIDALDGQGLITIRARREGESWVIVEIEDNGPGIPAEIQGKVFDTFFTTKEPGRGTGLGLDISYKIVLKHKGDIKLTSTPGQTCFQVWLPINFDAV
jgi:signal transduction histidine kinase